MKSDKEGVISAVFVKCGKWTIAILCVLSWFSADIAAAAVCGGMRKGREEKIFFMFPKLEMWNLYSIQILIQSCSILNLYIVKVFPWTTESHCWVCLYYQPLNKAQWFWSKCFTSFTFYCLCLIIYHISPFTAITLIKIWING